ncbi:putative membrane-bound metal-dependent hydrolase [Halorubrum coriense DSM 10284]|uniref:Putative membrane-bound metal-dependent hydrolase n=1 Tax=Halorubrum coriense DSM 10284 TaxID=1227466 RepID=M0EMH6_9EURY|nr:metal-dependent hydrolase [Halorubrum coriense]ELZ48971.1 putative membrane-bound metal-dependent hydrolase [Halorubrum coriense DSM 10284]QRG24138.1 YdjM-family membrane-bound hydrolase [Halorubrum virus Humcor1]
MHQKGHIGASLLVYAPFGFVLAALASMELAFIGAAAVGSMAMVPDLDMRIPLIKHRGITHTVWFALVVGAAFGLVGAVLGVQESIVGGVLFGFLAFGFGTLTIVSHLLADALTPMGIKPFSPVRDTKYTLDLFKAANPIANYALLGLGGAVVAVAVVAGGAVPL